MSEAIQIAQRLIPLGKQSDPNTEETEDLHKQIAGVEAFLKANNDPNSKNISYAESRRLYG